MSAEQMDSDVWNTGKSVYIIGNQVKTQIIEEFCREITRITGAKADWGYFGGRAIIKTLGNPIFVVEQMREMPVVVQGRYIINGVIQ